jgi:site-specific DNA-methyltransferase (adenine-specific)
LDIWIHKMERITDRIEIHHGDCYELLDGWPSSSALVTDPPYGISYQHSGGGNCGKRLQGAYRFTKAHSPKTCKIKGDSVDFDPAPFFRFSRVLLWGADRYAQRLQGGGTLLAWDKDLGNGPLGSFVDCEFAWTSIKTKRNIFRHYWRGLCCSKQGEGLSNPNQFKRLHVSQKPVALCLWCLRLLELVEGDAVIDPFMGSGSIGVACHQLGLRYIGVEIDEEHYMTARDRLKRETAQGLLNMSNPRGQVQS